MDYLYYQRKINDVIIKCPIEIGIEILVYNLLDDSIDLEQYSLVDINSVQKKQDSRLSTEGGISDIAVLSPDFEFEQEDTGEVYGFIEVKVAGVPLYFTDQISSQMKKVMHFIYTNGIVWQYYREQKLEWEKNIELQETKYSTKRIKVDKEKFEDLKRTVSQIEWKKKMFDDSI